MNKLKLLVTCLVGVLAILTVNCSGALGQSNSVMAADTTGSKTQIEAGFTAAGGSTAKDDLPEIVQTIINTMLFIVGMLAVVMIIYSGIRYVTAHGDKAQLESARNTLIYAIVGLVISIAAYAIVRWIIKLF